MKIGSWIYAFSILAYLAVLDWGIYKIGGPIPATILGVIVAFFAVMALITGPLQINYGPHNRQRGHY